MSHATKRQVEQEAEPVRVLGRGLRAQRGVHLTIRTLREAAGKTQAEVLFGHKRCETVAIASTSKIRVANA